MFDQIFQRSDALRRELSGPLREARLAYLRHRAEQGAPRSSRLLCKRLHNSPMTSAAPYRNAFRNTEMPPPS